MSATDTSALRRTIDWDDGEVVLVDQTLLPAEERLLRIREVDDLVEAICMLRVRGAMALGVAGGLGVALAVERAREHGDDIGNAARAAGAQLVAARPTATNLRWGVERALTALPEGPAAVVETGRRLLAEDIAVNARIAERGAELLLDLLPERDRPLRLLTHCNAGRLAGVEGGTALGIVAKLHERGLVEEVLACETRPLLQGARLTSWELARLDVPFRLIVDAAAASSVASGAVAAVVVGADRIAANGDVANKIGTFAHALAANWAHIPFIVAAPESTIDLFTADGAAIPIEERPESEVLEIGGKLVAHPEAHASNPAFDVTPAALVTAIVTERRVVYPARGERPGVVGSADV